MNALRSWLGRRGARSSALAVLVVLAVLAFALAAAARPGGGSSYHGSSSSHGSYSGGHSGGYGGGGSSGGSGSGSGILAIFELIVLCVEHPILGLIVLLFFGGLYLSHAFQSSNRRDWSTVQAAAAKAERAADLRGQLEGLRRYDEAFSVIIFEDFVAALYARVHAARAGGLDSFSAFLAPDALRALAAMGTPGLRSVSTVIVGALHFFRVDVQEGQAPGFNVGVEIEANYTETAANGAESAWYVREHWQMYRRASAPSRTPDKARVFACPSCGAPLDGVLQAKCRYCNKVVCTGEFDWVVASIRLVERDARGPMLTAETAEEGTDDPTIVAPDARASYAALERRDPALSWQAFERRVGQVFLEFQRAWAACDLAAMRPFLSDNLFEVEQYWIRAYQAQKLRNVTQNARITRLELARVTSDRFFDAITVRLFATGLDYTVRADDYSRVICGSKTRERAYTEYWTFIRSTRKTGPAREGNVCPNCGAPLAVNMAGACTYCSAKVTSGDFDWVLSRIEQDESYEGG